MVDTHAYCADTHMWITWRDNDARSNTPLDRARLVRRPAREVLVVGADPVADQARAFLRIGCRSPAWPLPSNRDHGTLWDVLASRPSSSRSSRTSAVSRSVSWRLR